MCTSYEEAVKSLEGQHKEELVQLENRYRPQVQKTGATRGPDVLMPSVFCARLKSFYQREWDKVHQIYQEEADKCCMLMEEQVRTHGYMLWSGGGGSARCTSGLF